MVTDQGEEKRLKIFNATLKLVSENGFHGAAMSKVAKEAGVSAGIIYHYFENKDELVIELYKTIKKKMAAELDKEMNASLPLSAQVRNLCENVFKRTLANPQETLFMQQFSTSPYHSKEVELMCSHHMDPFVAIFEKAQKELIIKKLPMTVIGTLTVDVASSLSQKQSHGLIDLTDELVEQVIDALWAAIRM